MYIHNWLREGGEAENGFQGIEGLAHMLVVAIKSEMCRGSWQAGNSLTEVFCFVFF